MIDILINLLDEHNEANIIAIKELNPSKVYYIRNKNDNDKMNGVINYYKNNSSQMEIKDFIVDEGDYKQFKNIINAEKDNNIIVNLTGGKRINSLLLLDLCIKNKITAIYIDIKNRFMYEFKDGVNLIYKNFEDLDIEDIVKAAGGKLVEDSLELYYKKDLIYFSEQISRNLDLWHEYKKRLYEASIFEHDSDDPKRIYIHKENLSDKEIRLLNTILNKLKEMKEINYIEKHNKITVDFSNSYLKSFIFKSGTWLEIETNKLVNKVDGIDESKNGVMFLWNNMNYSVRNELDVVAVKDSVPIFISCKDSDKYNEMALNELNVYANKIGGDNSYKILVATKEPLKIPIRKRAEEMGINLIIFDGDENKFIKEFKNIIKKS